MRKTSHVILRVSATTDEKIELLKRNREIDVYVIDQNQASRIKEKNGTIHISEEAASMFFYNKADVVYHWYKSDGLKRSK